MGQRAALKIQRYGFKRLKYVSFMAQVCVYTGTDTEGLLVKGEWKSNMFSPVFGSSLVW